MTRSNLLYALYGLLVVWAAYVLLPPFQGLVSSTYGGLATSLHSFYRAYADAVAPLLTWTSINRGVFAAVIIIVLATLFVWSIVIGLRQSKIREKDEVFGDPERTRGGWYWMVCGLASLALVWFYFSWGAARAFFPNAANEICQVATLNTAMRPIGGALPPRYFLGTEVIRATHNEISEIKLLSTRVALTEAQRAEIGTLTNELEALMSELSDPEALSEEVSAEIIAVSDGLASAANDLRSGLHPNMADEQTLLQNRAQGAWGIAEEATKEIPFSPISSRGSLFVAVAGDVELLTKQFQGIKNLTGDRKVRIDALKDDIKVLKAEFAEITDRDSANRTRIIRKLEGRSRAIARGTIFPPQALDPIEDSMLSLASASNVAQGGLWFVDAIMLPTSTIERTATVCTEFGSGRWLPKPLDVIARFGEMANIHLNSDATAVNEDTGQPFRPGGMKGVRLLWVKWLPISDVVAPLIPNGLVDLLPGDYPTHQEDGTFRHNFKSRVLAFTQGDVNLGYIPMLDGHVWDSLYRVIVAMALGIGIGVPLGIMMGASRFFKSYFDPLIELYRPIPPLAWAPLILTAIGLGDAGKITLLFMVALAIMIISARTGAISTQLSKIRASHSLGASNRQILRQVILPNALPEILTGIRIAIGVCWGTLVAAELLAGETGIGFVENIASKTQDYTTIWVTILIMGMLGFALDLLMRWVIAKTIPWRGKG